MSGEWPLPYPAPTTGGACGTVTCNPASGSFFSVGTTTVNCNASSEPGCSFTVTVQQTAGFDLCLQDGSNLSTALLISSSNGVRAQRKGVSLRQYSQVEFRM
jgi:hypothetical protein